MADSDTSAKAGGDPDRGASRARRRAGAAAALAATALVALHAWHFLACARSPLRDLPRFFASSDMQANLLWARSILEQGWLNPEPHHPFVGWMQAVGTREEWIRWWGGAAVYQQSPLYAYLLAATIGATGDILAQHILQALLTLAMIGALARAAWRISGDRAAGWITLAVAGAYGPFLAYGWAILRDGLGYALTAFLLLVLLELDARGESARSRRLLAAAAGLLLGMGYLAREAFALLAFVLAPVLVLRLARRRDLRAALWLAAGLALPLVPLAARNAAVGAPPLSTSNRFAEAFIEGHAPTASPATFVIPDEMRDILTASGGRPAAVVRATLATHDRPASWLRLQGRKLLSLLDPHEACDNLNLNFVARCSPVVRWSIPWPPVLWAGLGGLALGLLRRDRRHAWLWWLLPLLVASVMVGTPLSRYRQALAVLWMPWAGAGAAAVYRAARARRAAVAAGLAAAWAGGTALSYGPLALVPASHDDRPAEYLLAAIIHEQRGEPRKAAEMRALIARKFPELLKKP